MFLITSACTNDSEVESSESSQELTVQKLEGGEIFPVGKVPLIDVLDAPNGERYARISSAFQEKDSDLETYENGWITLAHEKISAAEREKSRLEKIRIHGKEKPAPKRVGTLIHPSLLKLSISDVGSTQ